VNRKNIPVNGSVHEFLLKNRKRWSQSLQDFFTKNIKTRNWILHLHDCHCMAHDDRERESSGATLHVPPSMCHTPCAILHKPYVGNPTNGPWLHKECSTVKQRSPSPAIGMCLTTHVSKDWHSIHLSLWTNSLPRADFSKLIWSKLLTWKDLILTQKSFNCLFFNQTADSERTKKICEKMKRMKIVKISFRKP
jgi:hypothetical protein